MLTHTRALRGLLVAFLFGLLMVCGLLYIISIDMAAEYPELAELRVPIYIAVLLGLIPILLAVKVMFSLLALVDRGEAFSRPTIRMLRQLKLFFAITAGYLTVGLIGVSVAVLPLQSPSLLLGWFACEVTLLFFLTLIALLERLFTAALELRQDNEMTV